MFCTGQSLLPLGSTSPSWNAVNPTLEPRLSNGSVSLLNRLCSSGSAAFLGHMLGPHAAMQARSVRTRTVVQASKQSRRNASNASTSSRKPPNQNELIAPQRPSSSSGVIIPLSSSSSTEAAAPASSKPSAKANLRHDSRRGPLVKVRVAPRRYRLRQSFDQPRRIHVDPTDPSFEGRMTSEINSIYGPRQLTKLIDDFGPYLTASHCASAISLLAGMTTGKQLQEQELHETYYAPAAKAAEQFIKRVDQASMVDCARAAYGLSRMQLNMPQLLTAVAAHSHGQLRTATPQALAGLAAGLAHWNHHPGEQWVQELCVESFMQMSSFGAQDLANLNFALAMWQKSVSQPFLLRCLTAFRGHWGSAGCHAPTLVRFIYALTQLPACQPLPEGMQQIQLEGAPVYVHHSEWAKQKEAQVLSKLMHMPGIDTSAAQQHNDANAAPAISSSSSSRKGKAQPATYRLPSFNWITAFLAECRRQIDRMKPAELATLLWSMASLNHTPDLIFMECWYRASAAHMHAFKPSMLAMALQALGMLQPGKDVPGGVSGRWLQAVLQHSQQLLGQCSGPELVKLLWGFAELRFWPGQAWVDRWMQATQAQMHTMQPSDLSDALWALARLRYRPPELWVQNLVTAVNQTLPDFSAQGLAVVIWGFTRLGLKPERQWLLRFKASSSTQYDDESAQQLAKFVAALLAQQNRQKFAQQSLLRQG